MKKFFAVFEKEYHLVNDRAKMERLEDDNGHKILHYIIVTPRLITNRIMFPCLYEIDGENGEYTFISSTRGQEAWNEKHKDLIKKLVVSEQTIQYYNFKPLESGGCHVTVVAAMNPNGMIPGMIKKVMGKAIATGV
mmetsp:Transcript_2150/g.1486  ORF Transcript_2150/g.1486 Transcript_2150/m.1486 type:complete len:136 (-) Transcript_2150:96-503(-)|eukprot:CAMPEP_0116874474 /NCGR_PEP_ID=MMETSP0463-20121206/5928_1 /TAXON_ID=181622 /ORGANISM="Strombidinopsis sp, Strain SopsisLIS2011" /LENGTH=135 /DNA_ID=CAMNT_0004518139 /DNA_START=219 /DNA_END=626 /DNA_ORIENTATION=-